MSAELQAVFRHIEALYARSSMQRQAFGILVKHLALTDSALDLEALLEQFYKLVPALPHTPQSAHSTSQIAGHEELAAIIAMLEEIAAKRAR